MFGDRHSVKITPNLKDAVQTTDYSGMQEKGMTLKKPQKKINYKLGVYKLILQINIIKYNNYEKFPAYILTS